MALNGSVKLCASFERLSEYVELHNYRKFNFTLNGVATSTCIAFGLLGICLLLLQMSKRKGGRLNFQLKMLCFWDSVLLLSRLVPGTVAALLGKMPRFYGWQAYLAFAANPIGSFAVSGTLWQVVLISLERYVHVLHPLWAHIYDQNVPIVAICGPMVIAAAILNLPPFFEHRFTTCMVDNESRILSSEIGKTDFAESSELYKLLCHLIPDLLFRCPLPFILVAFFTFRTVRFLHLHKQKSSLVTHCRRQQTQKQQYRVALALTALSVKFLVCNSLFTVHTVLDLIDMTPGDYWEYFLTLVYLSDVSNFLLLLNGATNWLLFYKWPRGRSKPGYNSIAGTQSQGFSYRLCEVSQHKESTL